jgi:hypothetical protein
MYPRERIAKFAESRLDKAKQAELNQEREKASKRILTTLTEHNLHIEIEEACQKWTHAYDVSQKGGDGLMTVDDAHFDMALANHCYWKALAQLDRLVDRTRLISRVQFWCIVVGGLFLALVQTVYAVLTYHLKP